MKDLELNTDNTVTMSSLDIAKLTGKEHADVMRDIRTTLKQADIVALKFAYVEPFGPNTVKVKEYRLPYYEAILVLAAYQKQRPEVIQAINLMTLKQLLIDLDTALYK